MNLKTSKLKEDIENWVREKYVGIAVVAGFAIGGFLTPLDGEPVMTMRIVSAILNGMLGIAFYVLFINLRWVYRDFKERYVEAEE